MALYTIIFEYRGGTYIRQVKAPSEIVAFQSWAKGIALDEIEHFGGRLIERIAKYSCNVDYQPVLLNGPKNVWCATWSGSGLVHIVKTTEK